VAWGKEAIEARLASLAAQAEDAVRSGYTIIILSDRKIDAEHVAIPALLALSAIHQHLVNRGLRTSTGLVVETGAAREVHHFALLGGYGAEAVHPYLAFETVIELAESGKLGPAVDGGKACKNFIKAVGKGLRKVMSKMGISTYMSYTGAQIFEAVGLSRALVEKYFTGTTSSVEGIGVFEVAGVAHTRVRQAQPSRIVRVLLEGLRERYDALVLTSAHLSSWRGLQFEAVRSLVDAQGWFVTLHGEIIRVIRSDKPLYTKLRIESLELMMVMDALRELIHDVERALAVVEARPSN
jgi:hypothetical protein